MGAKGKESEYGREGGREGRSALSTCTPTKILILFSPLEEHLLLKPCKNELFFFNQ